MISPPPPTKIVTGLAWADAIIDRAHDDGRIVTNINVECGPDDNFIMKFVDVKHQSNGSIITRTYESMAGSSTIHMLNETHERGDGLASTVSCTSMHTKTMKKSTKSIDLDKLSKDPRYAQIRKNWAEANVSFCEGSGCKLRIPDQDDDNIPTYVCSEIICMVPHPLDEEVVGMQTLKETTAALKRVLFPDPSTVEGLAWILNVMKTAPCQCKK